MDANPMQVLTQIAERNLAMWQAMSGMGDEEDDKEGKSRKQGGKDGPTTGKGRSDKD
jgi:hypothetical protein